jgi:hypothetical protein
MDLLTRSETRTVVRMGKVYARPAAGDTLRSGPSPSWPVVGGPAKGDDAAGGDRAWELDNAVANNQRAGVYYLTHALGSAASQLQ